MKRIILRPQALGDLADIRRYTRKVWGAAQARKYLDGMGRRFETIAAGTAASRELAELGSGYRRSRYGSHLIVFVDGPDEVRIVRVLHVRMDLPEKLGGS